MNHIWLNTKCVPESQAKVSVLDRGFLYGDGVYETVRVYRGRIFRAEQHWKRLYHSLEGIRLGVPWKPSQVTKACEAVVKANRLKECLVRVTITRGAGSIGYDPSTCGRPTLVGLASHIRPDLESCWEKGVKIAFAHVRRNHLLSLSPAVKHTNCLNGILAKMETLKENAFEGVFLNLDGYVAEGTISNIFIVKGRAIRTPSLDSGILEGVTRAGILEVAHATGFPVQETWIRPEEVLSADEVFLTSTTMEAMPVVNAGGKRIGNGKPGPVTRAVHRAFRALVERELDINLPSLPFL